VQSDIEEAKASANDQKKAGEPKRNKKTGAAINVSDSGQLLLLLKGATPGPGQKAIVTPPPGRAGDSIGDHGAITPSGRTKTNPPQPLASPIERPDGR
jgi:hypothetical protein